ncbi:hypothetical protein JCM16106_07610 [Hydrogenophilus islandicus]
MKRHFLRWSVPALVVGILLFAGRWLIAPAFADPPDQRELHAAVQNGEFLPFEVIIGKIRAELGGHLIETELEKEVWSPSGWVYEVKWLTGHGRLVKRYYDAKSGELLREKHKGQKTTMPADRASGAVGSSSGRQVE